MDTKDLAEILATSFAIGMVLFYGGVAVVQIIKDKLNGDSWKTIAKRYL